MSPGCKLSMNDSPKTAQEFNEMKNKPYREAIGAAQYASVGTRPDITFVVSQLSRYLENPGLAHWNAVKTL
jgi:predicted pyridoxine 5'-phosphate oxidase superfamily flavin-nucleotide-binding protein